MCKEFGSRYNLRSGGPTSLGKKEERLIAG